MKKHLSITAASDFAKMIIDDLKLPYQIVDESKPFDESTTLSVDADSPPTTKVIPKSSTSEWLDSIEKNASEDTEIASNLAALSAQLEEYAHIVRSSRSDAKKNGIPWEGPSDAELAALSSRSDWGAAVHCSWIRVILKTRPSVSISSPVTKIKSVKVVASATGELWAKHWYPKCVRRCPKPFHGLCCKWKSSYKWTKIASLTVRNVELQADARIQFSIENATSVIGRPLFDQLRLDDDIIREIQLEEIVNWFLRKKDQKFAVLEREDIEIEIELVGKTYTPEALMLPATKAGISIEAQLRAL